MIDPAVKKDSAVRSTGRLPKIWLKEAHDGWKTVEVRRNEVPVQNACIEVPFSCVAIVFG